MTDNTNALISDKPEDLVSIAQALAVHQSKPFYIAQLPNAKYKITSLIPHSPSWKKEKLEWVRTIKPTEK